MYVHVLPSKCAILENIVTFLIIEAVPYSLFHRLYKNWLTPYFPLPLSKSHLSWAYQPKRAQGFIYFGLHDNWGTDGLTEVICGGSFTCACKWNSLACWKKKFSVLKSNAYPSRSQAWRSLVAGGRTRFVQQPWSLHRTLNRNKETYIKKNKMYI